MVDYEYAELFNNDSLDKQIHIAIQGTQSVLGNEDIVSESFQLIESLCSEEYLTFGAVEPRCVKFTVKYSAPKLLNKWLTVTMDLQGAETPFSFGDYQVLSDKPSSDRTTREVTAYSHFHKILKNKYKNWYKNAWGSSKTMTIKQFRDSFFAMLHTNHSWVVQETTTLVNDSVVIKKSKKIPRVSGKDILNAICEINGVFGYIDREGVFRYKTLTSNSTTTSIGKAYTISAEYEDYTTMPVDRVEILSQNGDLLAYAGATESNSQNKYVVENNFMLKGMGENAAAQITAAVMATNMLNVVSNVMYVPFDANFKGNPCFEVGDRILFQAHGNTIVSYILSRTLKGIQSLRDNYVADSGDAVYPEDRNTLSSKMQKIKDYASEKAESTLDVFDPNVEGWDGQEGDLYFRTKQIRNNLYPFDDEFHYAYYDKWAEQATYPITDISDCFQVMSMSWGDNGYNIELYGRTYNLSSPIRNFDAGSALIRVPITEGGRYKFHCVISYNATDRPGSDRIIGNLIGFYIIGDMGDRASHGDYGTWNEFAWGGGVLNIDYEMDQDHEYEEEFTVADGWATLGYFYFCFTRAGAMYWTDDVSGSISMSVKDFYITKVPQMQTRDTNTRSLTAENTRSSNSEEFDTVIDTSYVNLNGNEWKQMKWLEDADTSSRSGLRVDSKRIVHLTPSVMRAWIKHDPPQVKRNFNEFCVRVTGTAYPNLNIIESSHSAVQNMSISRNGERVYSIKCGGTVDGTDNNIIVYKITGMDYNPQVGSSSGVDFAVKFSGNTQFNSESNRKACGILFNSTGTVSASLLSQFSSLPPATWTLIDNNLFYSFRRNTDRDYTNNTIINVQVPEFYMIVILNDVTTPNDITLTFTEFVLSSWENRETNIRQFYLSTEDGRWLKYKPFGSNDDGDMVDSLADLSDVALGSISDGQILKYDGSISKWVNANAENNISNSSDVLLNNLASGQILKWNGTKWVNANESGGGGGGSTVTITPTLSTGTKIADFSIDGISGELYAPQGGGGGSVNEKVIVMNAIQERITENITVEKE